METPKKRIFSTVFSFAGTKKNNMIYSVICAIISVFGGFIPYLACYQIILLFFEQDPSLTTVMPWIMICLGGYAIKLIFYGISTTLSHISAYQILENIRLSIAEKLIQAPLGEILAIPTGHMKNIIIDRVETIELPLAHMIPEGISNLLLPVAVILYMFSIDWRMALAALICVPLGAAVYMIMMKNFNSQYAAYMDASNHVNSVIIEYIKGIQVIKAFNQSGSSYETFANTVANFKTFTLNWFQSTWKLMNLGSSILPSTLLGLLPMGVYLYAVGEITPAKLTICMILSLSIIAPVSWFNTAVNNYKSIEYAIADVNWLLGLPMLPYQNEPVRLNHFSIRLNDISFAYDRSETDVIKNLSLTLKEGSFTALVGPSGGGKSTIARLIARFWDVRQGSITISGIDIRQIPAGQFSSMISYVSQDNFLFNCSLLENIRLGNPAASDQEVMNAAKAAQCEEFIGRLEHGWQTSAGEAGTKLSGGERQRIAIARAILKNAPIIILDEATAFTDPENEDKIQRSIAALVKDKTLLVIAHRLSTIKNADQIIVLKDGAITAAGTHDELLIHSPLYQTLWHAHIGSKKWFAGNSSEEASHV